MFDLNHLTLLNIENYSKLFYQNPNEKEILNTLLLLKKRLRRIGWKAK